MVGQAVNIVFPLRFGEAARVASLARRTGWPVSRLVMAVAVERFCDVGAFAAVVALLAVLGSLPPRLAGVLPALLLSILLTLAAAVAGIRLTPRFGGPSAARRNARACRRGSSSGSPTSQPDGTPSRGPGWQPCCS